MKCYLCPKKCGKDRDETNGLGNCKMPNKLKIAHYELFNFEEPCISINKGSGAVFFSGCNLDCVFCQNYKISQECAGKFFTEDEFIEIIKELENMGAENINLVSPTHYAIQIVEAFKKYKPKVPVIYNCNGYESEEIIKYVAPYVDVFLPDLKYYSQTLSERFSGVSDYFSVAIKAIKLMRGLKPDIYDKNGKILSGVIIRHMILPLCTDDSILVLNKIAEEIPNTQVSLLAQYTPYYKAKEIKNINRKITLREYNKVLDEFNRLGLNGYIQEPSSASEEYIPKFKFMDLG